jgi:hypothetical protein
MGARILVCLGTREYAVELNGATTIVNGAGALGRCDDNGGVTI